MALITKVIPSLINGVSQQPPAFRSPTQGDIQENGLSSVVNGLSKRPCSEHVAFMGALTNLDTAFIHTARRDYTTANHVVAYRENEITTVKVYNQDGVEKVVTIDDATTQTYLNSALNPKEDLVAVSIADFTYILNKTVVCGQKSDKTSVYVPQCLVWVKDVNYGSTFRISITKGGDTRFLGFATKSATQDTTALVTIVEKGTKTNVIAQHLGDFFNGYLTQSAAYDSYSNSTVGLPVNMAVSITGSVLHFFNTNGDMTDFTITCTDSFGGEYLKLFKGVTADFTKLPSQAPQNFRIAINGDNEKGQDDYWVMFVGSVWNETIAPDTYYKVDQATLPITLKKDALGNFHLLATTWTDRLVGDDTTNPFPSFIGFTIADIFFHKNRLGFLSDENVIMARAGEYESYDFFKKTVLTSVDSDVIDIAVSSNKVSILKHAVSFSDSLILFSELTQFKLTSSSALTASTVTISSTTEFEASLSAKPQAVGKYIYFASRRGEYGSIWEYFIDSDLNTNDAVEITSHVPSYIVGEISNIQASSNDNIIAVQGTNTNELYVYNYYWNTKEKVQSAWHRWTFSGEVITCSFNKSELTLVMRYSSGLYLERIRLTEDIAKPITYGLSIHLDRRFMVSTLPFVTPYVDPSIQLVTIYGKRIATSEAIIEVTAGRPVFGGVPYTFRYRFSQQFLKDSQQAPVLNCVLRVKRYTLYYSNSAYFKTKVYPITRIAAISGQASYDKEFTGRIVGAITNTTDAAPLDTGIFTLAVLGSSDAIAVDIENDTHFPCIFQSATWEATYTMRAQML